MKVASGTKSSYNRMNDEENFNFKSLILKYLEHKPFFIWSVLLAILIAFTVNQYTPPVYKIQSKFLIKEEGNPINLFETSTAGTNGIVPKGQKLANETIFLKSREIARLALDQLPFDIEYYEEGLFINSEIYKNTPIIVEADWNHAQLTNGKIKISWTDTRFFQLEFPDMEYQKYIPGERKNIVIGNPEISQTDFRFGEWITFFDVKLLVKFTGAETSGSLIIKMRDRESLLQQYTGDNLQIFSADKTSSILLLALDTHHPVKGTDYLNMLMKVFLENELNEKNAIARNTINFIDRQLSGISDSLSYSENKLEKFRSNNRTYNITAEANTIFEKLSELEKSLSQEQFKRNYYQSLQNYVAQGDYSEIIIPAGLGIEDPVLNKLIEDLTRYQADKSRYLATQTENSPTVLEVNRKIKDINNSINEALRNVNRNTNLLISDLQKRISNIDGQFGKLPETEQDLLNIKRKYSLNENIYTFLLQRRAEADISLASNTASNKIIEPAVMNFIPMRLKPMLNYLLALLLGFIVPIGIISLREAFSVRIKEIKDVEQNLTVPIVGCIGQNKYPPLVVFNHSRSGISEAFRAVRTNIDFIFQKDNQVTIMITSAIAGEGKSFCAMNLASVYSVCGKKTIIVECDMHKPFSLTDFDISSREGLSNFLSGQISQVKDIIQRTEYANLDVLAPGPIPPNPAELIICPRFKQLIQELKNRYDVIILDSSPLGLTNETLYLTRVADLTLFMLRQNYSRKSSLSYINSLKEKGIKKLYAVVNDVEEKDLSYGGYGYGYYDDDLKKKNKIRAIFKKVLNKAAF
ncbi:MAG: polysaccharide biosynthesis tyrosine autokinase [Cyclobacteriaceae bacterium]